MTFAEALDHLHELAPELAPSPDPTAPRRKFDLAHIRRLLAALGDPHNAVPAVLIAGTNGKGSTAATLASILTSAGYRTALYTSPHLIRVTERIQLAHPTLPSEYGATISAGAAPGADGPLVLSEIPEQDFATFYTQVEDAATALVESGDLPHPPSFFERLTAVAFCFFAARQAEIAVLEVGLGGRLDATNVVTPLLSIITDIALDHQDYLGDTIALITAEKCGILRERGTLITLPQLPEANHAIGLAATALDVHAINAARFIPPPQRASNDLPGMRHPERSAAGPKDPEEPNLAANVQPTSPQSSSSSGLASAYSPGPSDPIVTLPRNRYTLSLDAGETLEVDSPLPGTHQQRNIALAIAAALELRTPTNPISNHTSYNLAEPAQDWRSTSNQLSYKIPNSAIEAGIRNVHWPGRLEFIAPNLLLDVAHNPAGAWTLRSAIAALPATQPRTLIFSCLRDKSLEELSRILFPLFDSSPDADPERRLGGRKDHLILAPIPNPRAADVHDLLAAAHALGVPAHAAPHLAAALSQARQITPPGGLIIATGSVYLVGEIRALVLAEPHELTA